MRDTMPHSLLVHRAVERFHQLVRADDRLARHLIDEDRSGLPGHLAALLLEALGPTPPHWPYQLVDAYRRRCLSVDDFDRLGHYLLSTLLQLRVGPEALLRVGTVLGEIRGPVLAGAGPESGGGGPGGSSNPPGPSSSSNPPGPHRDGPAGLRPQSRPAAARSGDGRPARRRSSR
jgi:hypothetical protein